MKSILVAVAVFFVVLAGGTMDPLCASIPEELGLTVEIEAGQIENPGNGPSHVLKNARCNMGWLSWSMEESGITLEMLPKLRIGRRVFYPTNCADAPPAVIAADSEKIFAHERARLGIGAHRAAPVQGIPSEPVAPILQGVELDALQAQNSEFIGKVRELEAQIEAAKAAKGENPLPASKLAEELEKATDKAATLEGKLNAANKDLDEVREALKTERMEFAAVNMRRAWYGAALLASVVFLTWLVTYLRLTSDKAYYRMRKRRELAEEVTTVPAPLPPGEVSAKPPGGNGADEVPEFKPAQYAVFFDGVVKWCNATVRWIAKGVKPEIKLVCPNDGCNEINILPYNIKDHLANCPHGKHRGLRPVSPSATASAAS